MKLNKLTTTLFGGALLFGVAACTDEVEYTPAEPIAVEGVYLSDAESNVVDIPTDGDKVSINLYRVNADKAITVDLSGQVLDANGTPVPEIFSVPTQVSFPAGVTVVPIEIGVVFGDVTPEEEYTLDLKILGDEANPYGLTERNYVITYAPWSEWELYANGKEGEATVTFTVFLRGSAEMPLYERKSLVNENKIQYMVPDPLSLEDDPDFDVLKDCDWYYIFSIDKTQTITIDGQECYRVTTNVVDTQKPYAGGEKRLFACAWSIFSELLGTPDSRIDALIEQNGWKQSYLNPETGLISVYTVMVAVDGSSIYPQADGYEYILLPGFHNYWMEFSYLGNFVNDSRQESAVIQATRCPDIASYAYQCVAGKLSDSEIDQVAAEIKADTEAELVFDESTNLTFVLPDNGTYTLVAVGYDEGGNAVYQTAYTFDYETVMKESKWQSVGWCQYTDGFFINIWYNPAIGGQTWDVEVEEHIEQPGYYRLVNPYAEWPINLQVDGALSASGMYYLYINATDPDGVYVEESQSGIDLSPAVGETTGMSIFSSFAYYNMQNGVDFELLKQRGYCGTLKNGVITFPAGTLLYSEEAYDGIANANLDPNNPAFEEIQTNPNWDGSGFNPFLGSGTFRVDLTTLDKVAPMRAKRIAGAASVAIKKVAANPARFNAVKGKSQRGFRATKMSKQDAEAFGQRNQTIIL